MPRLCISIGRSCGAATSLWLCLLLQGCPSPYELRHENQWDSRAQILVTQASQLQLRAAQSRVFDSTDNRRILQGIIAAMQDLDFMVEVVDEELGIVSGKLYLPLERPALYESDYHQYRSDCLLVFSKTYRSWGPFWQRSDQVRLTVTVRQRNEKESVVRASLQFYLRPVEDPEIYRTFFRTVEKACFLEAHTVEVSDQ